MPVVVAAVAPRQRPRLEERLFQPLHLPFGDTQVERGLGEGLIHDRPAAPLPVRVAGEGKVVVEQLDHPVVAQIEIPAGAG